MELIRGLHNLKPHHQDCVLAIGNFDGVHDGHQHILMEARAHAKAQNLKTMVMTFEPHPVDYFQPDQGQARLTLFRHKYSALASCGIDYLLCLPFNEKTAKLTADDFIQEVLHQKLNVKHVIVGHDFYFGYKRQGSFDLLLNRGAMLGFTSERIPMFTCEQGQRVSSTLLREALAEGKVSHLMKHLKQPYTVRARVRRGDGRGRTWGFPTANLSVSELRCALPFGIYIVTATTKQFMHKPAVASFGVRPAVGKDLKPLLEVHILEGDYDLYDEFLNVEFLSYLRPELPFDSFDDLIIAIQNDCQEARYYFDQLTTDTM